MAEAVKKTRAANKKPRLAPNARRPRAERDRLSCHIDTRIKQRAQDAASLLGQDLSTFTETALDEKAQAVIERHARIAMSERDFAHFLAALENPAPPTAKLRAALADIQRLKAEYPEANI